MQSGQRFESYRDEEATDQQTTWQHRYTLLFFPPSYCLMSLISSPTIIIDYNEAKAHLHFFAYHTLQHFYFEVSTTDGATPRMSKKIYRSLKLRDSTFWYMHRKNSIAFYIFIVKWICRYQIFHYINQNY